MARGLFLAVGLAVCVPACKTTKTVSEMPTAVHPAVHPALTEGPWTATTSPPKKDQFSFTYQAEGWQLVADQSRLYIGRVDATGSATHTQLSGIRYVPRWEETGKIIGAIGTPEVFYFLTENGYLHALRVGEWQLWPRPLWMRNITAGAASLRKADSNGAYDVVVVANGNQIGVQYATEGRFTISEWVSQDTPPK